MQLHRWISALLTIGLSSSTLFGFQVFVNRSGKTLVIHDVHPAMRVSEFLSRIEERVELSRKDFYLTYAGRLFCYDRKKIFEYGLQRHSTVFLYERCWIKETCEEKVENVLCDEEEEIDTIIL